MVGETAKKIAAVLIAHSLGLGPALPTSCSRGRTDVVVQPEVSLGRYSRGMAVRQPGQKQRGRASQNDLSAKDFSGEIIEVFRVEKSGDNRAIATTAWDGRGRNRTSADAH